MKAKKGFTLVELIVVIAIIAILAAILIPLLVNHVRNSRCTQEFADATSGHNMIAERISDAFSRGIAPA
ncbi:MAG: prepilin-type N-terminal cleavage/methylation domain-containing protein, partial [Oscillospiraceae bacterium]|nr:prepilin-type N-terminal cleavage/methylation domain-containing protein [Oscillospiraceae bacterium]